MSSHRRAGYYRFLKLTGEKNRAIQSGVTRPRHDVARSRAECKVRGRLDQLSGCSRSQGGGGRTHSWERWLICFPGCRCRSRSFFVRACFYGFHSEPLHSGNTQTCVSDRARWVRRGRADKEQHFILSIIHMTKLLFLFSPESWVLCLFRFCSEMVTFRKLTHIEAAINDPIVNIFSGFQ